jgi:RNA polymerase sigma factor (sigma-70 family)
VHLEERTLIHGIFRDVSDRKRYEDSLEELNRAARTFLEAETVYDVAQTVVDVAAEGLDIADVAVYRYDEEEGLLVPASSSDSLEAEVGELPVMAPGESITWRVYATQEQEVFDDVRNDDDVYNPGTPFRSELLLPLGEHGVLLASDTRVGAFDDLTVELAEILTATAEAALDRIGWTQRLQARERDARLRADRLERVNQIHEHVRSILHTITQAETRQEIEHAVCTQLSELDRVAFAWIGELDYVAGELTPTAWAESGHEYLNDLSLQLDTDERVPAVETVQNRDVTEISNIAEMVSRESWRQTALLYDYQSVVSVPLAHQGIQHGVLSLYSARPAAFDDRATSVLGDLGELVGYALSAVEQRNALLDADVVELTFDLPGSEDVFVQLASRLESTLEIKNVSTRSDGSYLTHLLARDVDTDRLREEATELLAVDEVRTIGDSAPGLFELVVSEPCTVTAVADLAATVRSITMSETGSRITVSIPRDRNVRSFIEQFQDRFPDATLVERHDSQRNGEDRLSSLLSQLTDRQREILKSAYYGGFFEQPRESTGAELADSLGISQPSFSRQLRNSERKLLKPLYEPE